MFYRPHKRITLNCGDREMTKQSHKDECDIHKILRQYQRTGILSHISAQSAQFVDLPDSVDYQESVHILMRAEEAFSALPSQVRSSFDNDPLKFLQAFNDPGQEGRLRDLGLLKPKVVSSPVEGPPAPSTE